MLGLNSTGTCTCPTNTTAIIQSCEGNLLNENNSVRVITILYLYDVVIDGNVFSVLAYYARRSCRSSDTMATCRCRPRLCENAKSRSAVVNAICISIDT